jgi:glycosyltransferase involved in cell wall biosynthesis
MNIGIITTWFERGAAYVSKAYEETFEKEHNVYIYARGGEKYAKGDPNWDHPNVTFAPFWPSCFFRGHEGMSRLHFYNWVKKNDIQILFFNEQHRISIVEEFSSYGMVTGAYVDYYQKSTVQDFAIYDFLICNTKRHYSVFNWHPKCFFVQWGTDTSLFKPSESSKVKDAVTFFHSAGYGGTNGRKGTDILVRAFQSVDGNAKLIIHSQVPVQKYGIEIEEIINKDDRILFIEKTVTAPGLYHLGDVYVYPTKLEGIGLSVAEALSCGLPVITTDSAPMNEFVQNGENGSLVKVEKVVPRPDNYYWPETIPDENDLTIKMQQYVDCCDTLNKRKDKARLSAINYFDWKKNSLVLNNFVNQFNGTEGLKINMYAIYPKLIFQDAIRLGGFAIYKTLRPIWNYVKHREKDFRATNQES